MSLEGVLRAPPDRTPAHLSLPLACEDQQGSCSSHPWMVGYGWVCSSHSL